MQKDLGCCFTGYRPEKFGFELSPENKSYNDFTRKLYDNIVDLAETGVKTFYSGVAMGFDLIAAEAVVDVMRLRPELCIRLVACVPYIEQAKNYPPEWKDRYDTVLEECERVVLISDRYFKGCFHKRNRYMVDHSDFVVAYYSGAPGGTKNTVNYAESLGRTVINLYENTGEQMRLI